MVHEPTFSFTIPSYDDTVLECRVYNPPHPVLNSVDRQWSPRGAVVAHPYAPMGGCFDDNVVMTIAAELLKQEFVVGTFNFRYGQRPLRLTTHHDKILTGGATEGRDAQEGERAGRLRRNSKTIYISLDSSCIMWMVFGLLNRVQILQGSPNQRFHPMYLHTTWLQMRSIHKMLQ